MIDFPEVETLDRKEEYLLVDSKTNQVKKLSESEKKDNNQK
jgi:hypothetical protein